MKMAIFGSRTLSGEKVIEIIVNSVQTFEPESIITSGETLGVCEEARICSRYLAIPLKVYWLDESKCAGKYHHRSIAVLTECDKCLFIHDGKSKGTLNEIEVAQKLGKPYDVVLIKNG